GCSPPLLVLFHEARRFTSPPEPRPAGNGIAMPFPNAFFLFFAMYFSLKINALLPLASFGMLLTLPQELQAQTAPAATSATVTGTAVDGGAKAEPLPFATVLLRHAEATDTSLVATGQTTLSGIFELPKVP